MENSTHVIQYIGDLRDIQNKLSRLQRVNKTIADKFGRDFTKATEIVSRNLDKISSKPITLKGGAKATEEFRKYSTVIRTADGSLKTLTETQRRVNGAIKSSNTTMRDGAKVTRTFGENLKTLLTRASLTIPVWFAIRASVGAVFRTIRDGLKDINDFDRALQKLRRNVSATSTDLERDFKNVTEQIVAFSRESGVSVQDVTNAVQKFATVGFDVETSLQGGIDATKLAVNLFGDAEETAQAFARSLRVLTVDMDSNVEQQRAISEALALTDQLWQTNAFEISEFSNNLEKFAGTAKIANLSIEDTLTLLATLSTAGLSNRGGRLIRSTLLRALADFENINRELGLGLDPNETPTIDFVLKLVDALKELRTTETIPANLSETLGDLFSVRSTEALAGLTALEKILRENIALEPDVAKFNDTFEEQSEQVNRLTARIVNLNKELGRTLVTGLVGGEDFEDSLKSIIEIIEGGIPVAKLFSETLGDGIRLALDIPFKGIFAITDVIGEDIDKAFANAEGKARAGSKRIAEGLRGGLGEAGIQALISDLVSGDIDLPAGTASRIVEILADQLILEEEINDELDKRVKKQEKIALTTKQSSEISELLLKNELDILKSQGARASQITEAEIAIRKQFSIEGDINDQLARQIQKRREISEEQRLSAELGNESLKLFRIAQTEGVDVAKNIGDVLSKQISFEDFVRRGGKALEVFERDFSSEAEQARGLQFFRGERISGAQNIRGGLGINIQEEAIRRRGTPVFDAGASLAQQRAESAFQRIQADVKVDSTLKIDVTGLETANIADKVKGDIIKEMQNPESEFSKGIDKKIDSF